MKSLLAENKSLAKVERQLEILSSLEQPFFDDQLLKHGLNTIDPTDLEIFQINMGKMCNQVCKHCHVDAGPDRKEKISREHLELCLKIVEENQIPTVDLTGGAPEMHPDFRWFVEQLSDRGVHVMVRCNLTIILANKKYHDLPEFYKKHKVEVVSSLPHFTSRRTDSQRGDGVFEKSIQALQMLNEVGYGVEGSGLTLNLVYNPAGAFLPDNQQELEKQFKLRLANKYQVVFNQLFAITNIPISRFLDYLVNSGNYEEYMEKLVAAFNPAAVQGLMCRNTISVSWDGSLYDCDFNQMLGLEVACQSQHLSNFNINDLQQRKIVTHNHCYGCTAGAGSSCGGQTV